MASLASAPGPITQLVVCYPGRFQPCGAHHATTFRLLKARFSAVNAYTCMLTSNKVELPKSPLNFEEKLRFINAQGIHDVVQTSNMYGFPTTLVDNFDPATTAVIFAVGKKDMATRFRNAGGLKKNGQPTYHQHYTGNIETMVSYRQHGYLIVAPHVRIEMPGIGEMSGSSLRRYLSIANKEEFASVMGYHSPELHAKCIEKFVNSRGRPSSPVKSESRSRSRSPRKAAGSTGGSNIKYKLYKRFRKSKRKNSKKSRKLKTKRIK